LKLPSEQKAAGDISMTTRTQNGAPATRNSTRVRMTRACIFTGLAVAAGVLLYNAYSGRGLNEVAAYFNPASEASPAPVPTPSPAQQPPQQQMAPAAAGTAQADNSRGALHANIASGNIASAIGGSFPISLTDPGGSPASSSQMLAQAGGAQFRQRPAAQAQAAGQKTAVQGASPQAATPTPQSPGAQPGAMQPATLQPGNGQPDGGTAAGQQEPAPAAAELDRLRAALKQANLALATYERKHAEFERQRQAANLGPQALQQQLQAAQSTARTASVKMQWYHYWYDTMLNGQIKLPLDSRETVNLDLIYAPPAALTGFLMGRSNKERVEANSATNGLLHDNSYPAHTRYISAGFFIGRTEVSNAQYYEYLQASGADGPTQQQWAVLAQQHPHKPAVKVNWQEARNFCQWLGAKHRLNIRLPTEVEWEYAARGPYAARFAKVENSTVHKPRTVAQGAEAVAAPTADFSWLSVQRMSGNVSEWCTDLFEEDAYARLTAAAAKQPGLLSYTPLANPPGWSVALSGGNRRSVRGGAFGESAVNCEAASRRWKTETTRRDFIGFRVVLVPAVPK